MCGFTGLWQAKNFSASTTSANEVRLQREMFFKVSFERERWQEHLSGKYNWQILLWNILMFQARLEGER